MKKNTSAKRLKNLKNRGYNENAAFSTDTILHMGNTINTGLNTFNRLAPGLLKKTSRKVN